MATGRNLAGEVFGRLTVLRPCGERAWDCMCVCGNYCVKKHKNLLGGKAKSCGCLQRETRLKNFRDSSFKQMRHGECAGGKYSRTYSIWKSMIQRATNPKHKYYPRYGGRGIVCDHAWLDFVNFYSDMGKAPEGRTLDRLDGNGPYNRDNCVWATRAEQTWNRVNSYRVTAFGQERPVGEWASLVPGLTAHCIKQRLQRGWAPERAVSEAPHPSGPQSDKVLKERQLAKEGITDETLTPFISTPDNQPFGTE